MNETKKCPKCAEEISSSANKCKHCQSDLRNWFLRHKILTGLLAFFLFMMVVANLDPKSSNTEIKDSDSDVKASVEEKKAPEFIKISAKDLFSAYNKNEIAADQQYKDKALEVSGKIYDISEMFGVMNVILDTGDFLTNIQCMMAESERDNVATLNKGQFVTLQGQNDGKGINIVVKDCVIK